jgi:SOS-response transcriptional repressor LexA
MSEPYGLTPLQRDALLVIQEIGDTGSMPSYEELKVELGLSSKSSVQFVLKSLRARGYIDWISQHSRSLRVLQRIEAPEEPMFVGFFEDESKAGEAMEN